MAESKKNYYDILGVSKKASSDEIKSAYRRLAKQYHPDLHPGDAAAAEKFKEINEANEILSDAQKRAAYDYELEHPGMGGMGGMGGFEGGFGDFSDIFSSIFGGRFRRLRRRNPYGTVERRRRYSARNDAQLYGCRKGLRQDFFLYAQRALLFL